MPAALREDGTSCDPSSVPSGDDNTTVEPEPCPLTVSLIDHPVKGVGCKLNPTQRPKATTPIQRTRETAPAIRAGKGVA